MLVTGASRGIGAAFSKRIARDGAHVVLTGRSAESPSHPRLQGTLSELAEEIRTAGGSADVFALDVRDERRVSSVVKRVIETHKRLDVVVNNASAIDISPTPRQKNAALMLDVNARGTMMVNLATLSELKRTGGQILSLSPPLDDFQKWLPMAPPYAVSKYGMTMATIGFAAHVKANCLWPKRTVATAATAMLEARVGTAYHSAGRSADYFAEAMLTLLTNSSLTGKTLLDEDVLPYDGDDSDKAPLDMFV